MIAFAMEKLKEIFFDFLDNLEEKEYLCELKNFGFKGEVLPDYQNKFIQQYYLLKYFPAYLTEYYFLYNEIIKRNFIKENYNILSIGCGCGIDFWGMKLANEKSNKNLNIKYTGVDIINWSYWENYDYNAKVITKDILSFDLNDNNYNIIIFPKSIGEFNDEEFSKLKDSFRNSNFLSDKLTIVLSLRKARNTRDARRGIEIFNIIQNELGYIAKDPLKECYSFEKKRNGFAYRIEDILPEFGYPSSLSDFLSDYYLDFLEDNPCPFKKFCEENVFSRKPVKTMSQVCFNIVNFERRQHDC
ncbi:MAG: class I SAM-dependent methyltransferase [Fusobacterium sp.]